MVCRNKIMGKFEVGHWMGAKKRGGGNAGYRTFEKGLGSAFYTTVGAIDSCLRDACEVGAKGREGGMCRGPDVLVKLRHRRERRCVDEDCRELDHFLGAGALRFGGGGGLEIEDGEEGEFLGEHVLCFLVLFTLFVCVEKSWEWVGKGKTK